MSNNELTAPCGLYCGICGIHRATVTGDQGLMQKLAAAYSVPVEKISCNGCLSEKPFVYCRVCHIKSCTAEKGYEGCHQCGEFPCIRIDSFPVPEGKMNILRAIPEWRRLGTEEFIKAEEKLFSCGECGSLLFRGARKCRECGAVRT